MKPSQTALFALAIALDPAGAQRSIDTSRACYASADHAQARKCIETAALDAETALERTTDELRLRIAAWDEDPAFRDRSLSALEESTAAFWVERTKACDFQASVAAGGNAQGDRRLLCSIELDHRREQDLRDTMNAFTPRPAVR